MTTQRSQHSDQATGRTTRGALVRFPTEDNDFCVLLNLQPGSDVQPPCRRVGVLYRKGADA